ncbi:DnaJ domain [Trypanosoma melophagium]|uniref:DnaJ domain n=1 Tax=Trypanosoma melophagium TaxID=715481 RepID=UPI00351A24B3|nr:DnaJ domain [Trypanosoma melophagium]
MDILQVQWILENKDNYYDVLKLTKTASEAQIRRSYYKLAVQLHPDKNSGNTEAADAFRVVANAYNVLMDKDKRRAYDYSGVEGVSRLETLQSLSIYDVAAAFFQLFASIILCAVARQTQSIELVLERYPWTEQFIQKTETDEFAIRQRSKRAILRRTVRRRFAFLLLFLFSLIVGHEVLQQWFHKNTEEKLPWTSYQHLRRTNTKDAGATFLCDPSSVNVDNNNNNNNISNNDNDINNIGGTRGVERRRNNNNNNNNTSGVLVWRPTSVSDEHARYLCRLWVQEMCPLQRQLAWASRERYEPTATLRVHRKLKALPSPNRAAKHKWAFKKWRPRFMESFSVKSPEELFVVSPLCEAFG